MGAPFKVHDPQPAPPVDAKYPMSPPLNAIQNHVESGSDNDDITEAAEELGAAPPKMVGTGPMIDRGGMMGEDHMQHPMYPPAMPWPPAKEPAKPYKF